MPTTSLSITEAGTVQFPMVKHAVEIGWAPLTPEEAKAKRGGEAGMLLRDELAARGWQVRDGADGATLVRA